MDVRCPNCNTSQLQTFRRLTSAELKWVALTRSDPQAYRRCTGNNGNCTRYQRYNDWQDGGDFPL
ncbi:hypothetical protein ACFY1L_11075 [Streptomyces sp. NPDC001663]|uniref:hypothetical protein n=1 Tax=Streptomyces sp. NPDC001663 TaxID=3364597 RepID=UPI0036A15808